MSSMKTMLCVVLLIASAIVSINCDTGKFSSCCTRVSSAKTKDKLVDFVIQKMDLPCVDAVMFITDQGKILCARPNIHWVKMKIKEIESKRAESDKAN